MNIGVKESKLKSKIQGISELSGDRLSVAAGAAADDTGSAHDEFSENVAASDSSVGAMLLAARLKAGEEISDIASLLRIRPEYLSALEQGKTNDLPGMTYAIGYVRTYARHLGLDSDRAVEVYKQETDDVVAKTQLVFPSPAPEGKVPGGTVMAISVVLAVAVYGGWYYLSSNDISVASLIPATPGSEQVAESDARPAPSIALKSPQAEPKPEPEPKVETQVEVEPAQPVASEVVTAPAEAPTPAAPVQEQVAETAEPVVEPEASPEVAAVPAAVETEAVQATPDQPAAENVTASDIAPQTDSPVATPEVAKVEQPAAETSGESFPVAAPEEVDSTVVARVEEDEPSATQPPSSIQAEEENLVVAATPNREPRAEIPDAPDVSSIAISSAHAESSAAGEVNRTPSAADLSRITIRAVEDSWVQVRDNQSRPIMTRVMRAGEEFAVPDQPGLELFTGNAGALNILVDGEGTPSIGPFGKVVRHVRLDAELLKSGLAVN